MRTDVTRPPIGWGEDPSDDRELYGTPQHEDESDGATGEQRLYGDPQHETLGDTSAREREQLGLWLGDFYGVKTAESASILRRPGS